MNSCANTLEKYHDPYIDKFGNERYCGFPQSCIGQDYISPSLYHEPRNEFGYTDGNYRLKRYELPIGNGEPICEDYLDDYGVIYGFQKYNFEKEKFDERMKFAKEFHKLYYNKKINLIIKTENGYKKEKKIVGDFINDWEFELL